MKLFKHFLAPSTQKFFHEANTTTRLTYGQKIHAYVYLKWAYQYISIGTGEHPIAKAIGPVVSLFNSFVTKKKKNEDEITFADTYHGKVVTAESARKLVTLNQKIELRELEQIIPYKRAKDIVLRNPDHIAALECPCRLARKNPCTPVDVCLIIGEPFVSFVLEHHSSKARAITSQEAEKILQEEHKRGHVHHAFFKDAMLNRFYAICNCCSCCCGAMQAHSNGTPMLAPSGYVCRVKIEDCKGCGLCVKKCQFNAITLSKEKKVTIDFSRCMGCGACISACKPEALYLEKNSEKGLPLEIHELLEQAHRESKK